MCGRFSLTEPNGIVEQFNIVDCRVEVRPRYNIAPSQPVPVVVKEGGSNRLRMFRWGMIPGWAKDVSIGNKLINARAETLAEKPSFCRSLAAKRCLILADGFYEWKKAGRSKIPYRITLQSHKPFAFAGLWDSWLSRTGQIINSCTIITTTPNRLMEQIHNRMPVILPQGLESAWLSENLLSTDVKSMLRPLPAEDMVAYEVNSQINSNRNDSPECIAPIDRLF